MKVYRKLMMAAMIAGGALWSLFCSMKKDERVFQSASTQKSDTSGKKNAVLSHTAVPANLPLQFKKKERVQALFVGHSDKIYRKEKEISVEEIAPDDLISDQGSLSEIPPVSAWQVDIDVFRSLNKGDIVAFSLDGVAYPIEIIQKEHSYGEIITLFGKYEDQGVLYHSVMTIGEDSIEVSLVTPDGQFESSMHSGTGYVYRASSIEEHWVDPSLSDTLEAQESTPTW